jgi:hypothetical protein
MRPSSLKKSKTRVEKYRGGNSGGPILTVKMNYMYTEGVM